MWQDKVDELESLLVQSNSDLKDAKSFIELKENENAILAEEKLFLEEEKGKLEEMFVLHIILLFILFYGPKILTVAMPRISMWAYDNLEL